MQKSFGVAKVLTLMLGLTALATVPVHADTISYQNALVTLNVTSNDYVTVTITGRYTRLHPWFAAIQRFQTKEL